jgi:UDPglucose 6-dehydrogenase
MVIAIQRYFRTRFLLSVFSVLSIQAASLLEKPKRISVLGTGYVGLVAGTCLAHFGHKVICADTDKEKISTLNKGGMPIFEPGLKEMLAEVRNLGSLTFTDKVEEAIKESEIVVIAVGTPTNSDGRADISAVEEVAKLIGQHLNGYKIICTKSTVPIGTGHSIKNIIQRESQGKHEFDVVSNPEFLKEGSAIKDFLHPYRIVLGVESERARQHFYEVYEPLLKKGIPFHFTDIVSAETIKYAANAFLAVKIAYINEIANLCEYTGADIREVAKGMGLDPRIGSLFLNAGPGWGGSCFPKDTYALSYKAKKFQYQLKIVEAAREANELQKKKVFEKLMRLLGGIIKGKTIAVLGLAFKANTDDIREAPALTLIEVLQKNGAHIKAYDPLAMDNMKKILPHIQYCSSIFEAVTQADAIVVLTEWHDFKTMDLAQVRKLVKQPLLLDTRNIISTRQLKELGFTYENIGNARIH